MAGFAIGSFWCAICASVWLVIFVDWLAFLCGKWYVCMNGWPVENSNKNHKNIVQKVVDVSIFWEYYRDSS